MSNYFSIEFGRTGSQLYNQNKILAKPVMCQGDRGLKHCISYNYVKHLLLWEKLFSAGNSQIQLTNQYCSYTLKEQAESHSASRSCGKTQICLCLEDACTSKYTFSSVKLLRLKASHSFRFEDVPALLIIHSHIKIFDEIYEMFVYILFFKTNCFAWMFDQVF